MTQIVKPKFPAKTQRFHMGEISIGEAFAGRRLGDLMQNALSGLQVTMVRKGEHNLVPNDDTVLAVGDAILVVAEDNEAIATAAVQLGKLEPGRLARDRRTSTTSGSSLEKPARSVFRLLAFRCPPAIRPICCTFGGTTPTWSRPPT